MAKTQINYRAGRGSEVYKAWCDWRETMPGENHAVTPFVAGYNAACVAANQGYQIVKDGDQWCCTGPGFINLQESIAGFGRTATLALDDYHANVVRAAKVLLEGDS